MAGEDLYSLLQYGGALPVEEDAGALGGVPVDPILGPTITVGNVPIPESAARVYGIPAIPPPPMEPLPSVEPVAAPSQPVAQPAPASAPPQAYPFASRPSIQEKAETVTSQKKAAATNTVTADLQDFTEVQDINQQRAAVQAEDRRQTEALLKSFQTAQQERVAKESAARQLVDSHKVEPKEFSNLGKALFMLMGSLEGFMNPGQPNQTAKMVAESIARDQEQNLLQLKKKQGDLENAKDAVARGYQTFQSDREAILVGTAANLKALETELQTRLDKTTNLRLQAKYQEMLASINQERLGVEMQLNNVWDNQDNEKIKLAMMQAKAASAGAGGGAKKSSSFEIYASPESGLQLFDSNGNQVSKLSDALPPGVKLDKELANQLDGRLAFLQTYADAIKTLETQLGTARNLVNDKDKEQAMQQMSRVVAEMIRAGGRSLSDSDLEALKKSIGADDNPQGFFTLLDADEKMALLKSGLASQTRDVNSLVRRRFNNASVNVQGKATLLDDDTKTSAPSAKETAKAVWNSSTKGKDGGQFLVVLKDIADYPVNAENRDKFEAAFIAANQRLAGMRDSDPAEFKRLSALYAPVRQKLEDRYTKSSKASEPKRPVPGAPTAITREPSRR